MYQIGFYILLGFVVGVILSVKWINPPSEDIHIETSFGKLKIRGKQHTVTDILDVDNIVDIAKEKKPTLKERRAARKAEKKSK